MWINRKKYIQLERRIADLEGKVLSQPEEVKIDLISSLLSKKLKEQSAKFRC